MMGIALGFMKKNLVKILAGVAVLAVVGFLAMRLNALAAQRDAALAEVNSLQGQIDQAALVNSNLNDTITTIRARHARQLEILTEERNDAIARESEARSIIADLESAEDGPVAPVLRLALDRLRNH